MFRFFRRTTAASRRPAGPARFRPTLQCLECRSVPTAGLTLPPPDLLPVTASAAGECFHSVEVPQALLNRLNSVANSHPAALAAAEQAASNALAILAGGAIGFRPVIIYP